MAPRWPQVNNGPEHINEHAAYLREACSQLQAVNRGRQSQIPWNIVQSYLVSAIALAGKVLQQPALHEVLHHVRDAVQCTQSIQRDVLVIKNSVGLSTASLNATNFRGGRTAAATWAQVAAQAKGPPVAPPPIPHGTRTTTAQSGVTAYKDRAVTVKLKDHGVAQRLRLVPAPRIRQQVETAVRGHAATRAIKVVAAHQLKSGDIQIFTSSTAEATKLRENTGWTSGLGEHAELIVPTYGVIVHGISTASINIKDQRATIQQMLADNHTVIPKAEISFVGWLTRESPLKRASSIVVEFKDPEMANAIIYTGMAWDGQIHTCQLYDRACRVKQCFRCYNYGHIGAQCGATQTCGYCAELHETKNCKQKGEQGFTPRCAVCKGVHTAWSNACPARKKELDRVEQAKQIREVYWRVTSTEAPKNDNAQTARRYIRNREADQAITIPETPISDPLGQQPAGLEPLTAEVATIHQQLPPSEELQAPQDPQGTHENMMRLTATDLPAEGDRETPATQEVIAQQLSLIDPRLLAPEQEVTASQTTDGVTDLEATEAIPPDDAPGQPSSYPLDGIEGNFNPDTWLANFENDYLDDGIRDTIQSEGSPLTSLATDTRTAQGALYMGCKCPEHQEIYDSWPTCDAELAIAKCMRICMYCGKDFGGAVQLRKHIKIRPEYIQRHLTVATAISGRGTSSTPGWTYKPYTQPPARPLDTNTINNQTEIEEENTTLTRLAATDPGMAQEKVHKACSCPDHQSLYDAWPTRNASLDIAMCMMICTYCGHDCKSTGNLRKHMAKVECPSRNLEIKAGTPGRGCSLTPGWTPKDPRPEDLRPTMSSSGQPNARATRSQTVTHSATIIHLE